MTPIQIYLLGIFFGFLIGLCIPILMQKGHSSNKDVFFIPSEQDVNGLYSSSSAQNIIGILSAFIGAAGVIIGLREL